MKIKVEHTPVPENEVVLRCPELDEEMLWVLSLLRSGLQRLLVWDPERRTVLLPPGEVVYCESLEDKIFVYTAGAVYQTALSLAELEGRLSAKGGQRDEETAKAEELRRKCEEIKNDILRMQCALQNG